MAARKTQLTGQDATIEELHRNVSRKESRGDNDVIVLTETTQILRRMKSSPRATPILQKVVITKVTKKDVNGSIIDETENEVVENLNDKSEPFLMAFDVTPSRTVADLKDRENSKRTLLSASPTRSIKKRPSETMEIEGSLQKNSVARSPVSSKTALLAKKLANKSGELTSKPGLTEIPGLPGVMVRTVEVTRTITVRDNDKPWRINSKQFPGAGKNTDSSRTRAKAEASAGNLEVRSPRNDLHGKVLKVVQKYIDSEGCAVHGCKHSHEPEDELETEKRPRTTRQTSSLRAKKLTTEPPELRKEPKTSPRQVNKPAKVPLAELQRDMPKTEIKRIEMPAGNANSPTEKKQITESHMLKENVSDHFTQEADTDRETGRAEDEETAVSSPQGYRSNLRLSLNWEKSDSAPVPENDSSKEKLAAVSPTLGSPAVVMRARSLFQSTEPSSQEENNNLTHSVSPKTERKTSLTSVEPTRKLSGKTRRCSKDGKIPSNFNEKTTANRSSPLREARTPAKDQHNSGAALRRSPEPAIKGTKSQGIEDIDDLELLESMLNSAKGYDERSKIRAQIRAVKKKSFHKSSDMEKSDQDQLSTPSSNSVKPRQSADLLSERRQSASWRQSPEKESKDERQSLRRKSLQRESPPKDRSDGKEVKGVPGLPALAPGMQDVVQEVPWRRKSSTHSPSTQISSSQTSQPSDYPSNEQAKGGLDNKEPPRFRSSMLLSGLIDRSPAMTEANGHDDNTVREDRQSPRENLRKQETGSAVMESLQGETSPAAPVRPKANLRDSLIRHLDLEDNPLERDSTRSETYPLQVESKEASLIRNYPEGNSSSTAAEYATDLKAEYGTSRSSVSGQRRVSSTDVNTQSVTSSSFVLLNSSPPAALEDPTPWRRRSSPRESSAPPADSPLSPENPSTVSAVKSLASKFQSQGRDTSPISRKGGLHSKDNLARKSPVAAEADLNDIKPKMQTTTGSLDQTRSNKTMNGRDVGSSSTVRRTSIETKTTVSSNMRKASTERKNSIPSSNVRRGSVERKTSSTSVSSFSARRTSRETSPEKLAAKLNERPATRPKSFLEDKTPVKGVQDIIQRMRATDALVPDERRSEDDEARSLLNKFLGAQILVQCAEPLVCSHTPDLVETVVSSTQERSEERKISTSSVAKGYRGSFSEATDDRASKTNAATQRTITNQKDMAEPCIVDGVDINTCEDDFKLNELLDSCNDYETRRKIRARIKVILSDPMLCSSHVQESGSTVERGAINNRSLRSLSSFSSSSSTSSSASTASSSSTSSSSPSPSSSASSLVCQNPSSAAPVVGDQAVVDSVVPHAVARVASVESFACSNATTTMTSSQTEEDANHEELFDSGTESGEDSTKSNNTDPELNSFMENLRLSLDISKQGEMPKETAPLKKPAADEASCTPDFFKQVDCVLDRLKTSLNTALEETGDFSPKVQTTCTSSKQLDQQEVLHEFIATGGLSGSQKWKVDSAQGQELISLIDRLQNSLQKLQTNEVVPDVTETTPISKPEAESVNPTLKSARDKIQWQENIVKESNRPVPSSRPVWCKPVESKVMPQRLTLEASKPVNPSRVLVEKQGVRGRFFHYPQLQPAPKVEPKVRPKSTVITSTLLSPSESTEPADQVTKASLKVQVNLNTSSGILVKVAEKASEDNVGPTAVNQPMAETVTSIQGEFEMDSETPTRVSTLTNQNDAETASVPKVETPERRHLEGKARDLPWKVKAAKKRAGRSQTTGFDGSVSVDIRKSLQMAARRKSREETEDVVLDQADASSSKPSQNGHAEETIEIQTNEKSPKCLYPILKQKSLGDLYNPKPKPFSQQLSYDATPSYKTRSVLFVDSYDKAVQTQPDEKMNAIQSHSSSPPKSSAPAEAVLGSRANAVNLNNSTKENRTEPTVAGDQDAKNSAAYAPKACEMTSEPQEQRQPASQSPVAPIVAATRSLVATPSASEEGEEDIITQSMTICKVPLRRQEAFDTARTNETPKTVANCNTTPRNTEAETQESSELKDPSKFLFTKSESIQIAIHKAAIKKQLSQEESKRRGEASDCTSPPAPVVVSPGQPVQVELRFSPMKCKPAASFTTGTQDKSHESLPYKSSHTNSKLISAISQDNNEEKITSKSVSNPASPLLLTACKSKDAADLGKSNMITSAPAVTRDTSTEEIAQKVQEPAQKNVDNVSQSNEPSTEAASQKDKVSRFSKKTQNKDLMRRANTVDISATLRKNGTTSWAPGALRADDSKNKSFTPLKFEPKTENDKKFLAFLDRNTSTTTTTQFRPAFQKSPQSAVVPMWTNKFSNLRSSFEQKAQTPSDTPRSRRPSEEMTQDSASVTSGNLKLQVTSGQMVITSNKNAPKQQPLVQQVVQPTPKVQHEVKHSSKDGIFKESPKALLQEKREHAVVCKEEPVEAIRLVLGSTCGRLTMKESLPTAPAVSKGPIAVSPFITKETMQAAPKKPIDPLPSKVPVQPPNPVLAASAKNFDATKSKCKPSCLQRSGSSFMTQSSESDKEDEEVKDVKDGEFGDDEASSSSDESSDDANAQTRPHQSICSEAVAVQNLTKTIYKLSSFEEDVPPTASKNGASVSGPHTTAAKPSIVPEISSTKEVENWNSKPSKSSRIAAFETNQLQNSSSEVSKSYYFPVQDSNPVNKMQEGIKKSFSTNFSKSPLIQNASFNSGPQRQMQLPFNSDAKQGFSGTLQKSFSTASFRQIESQTTKTVPKLPIFSSPNESTLPQKFPSALIHSDSPKVSTTPFIEPPGPALVGLVASNVRSYLPTVNQPVVKPQESLFRRSLHEATVTNAAVDLSRRQRPQSLVLLPSKENNIKLESVSPRSGIRSVPMKQYEAAMSPESAEKKQQEILKYFGSLPPTPSNASQEPLVVKKSSPIPSVVPRVVQQPLQPQTSMINKPKVEKRESRREDVDFDDLISDIDDVFDALVANSDTLKRVKRSETTTATNNSASVAGLREASRSTESYFSSRRQAWEQSSSTKVHLNASLQLSCQNELAKNIGNLGRTAMTRSEVVTKSSFSSSTVRQSQPISAFSKFQQLDKNVKTTPSLAMPVVRARMSAAAIKEKLLQFCRRATADYQLDACCMNPYFHTSLPSKITHFGFKILDGRIMCKQSKGAFLNEILNKIHWDSSPQNSPLAKDGQQFRLGEGLTRSASGVKDVLLRWCQARTAGYKNVQIENFSSSWNNGLAFCALIHHFYPDAFDYESLKPENRAYNFELAFKTAEEKAGIAPLLDVEDMVMMLRPDWKCVFTYVQSIYRRLKDD